MWHPKHLGILSLIALLAGCGSQDQAPASARAETPSEGEAALSPSVPRSVANPDIRDRLDRWLALVQPGASIPASSYASFLREQPAWPERAVMLAQYQNALANRTADAELPGLCPQFPLTRVQALLRCAPYVRNVDTVARKLWVSGVVHEQDEAAFLARFGTVLTAADEWQRFEHLDRTRLFAAARRQIDRLPTSRQPLARTRLAYRASTPDADSLFATLSSQDRNDPALTLARLHHLRRADLPGDALTLWNESGYRAQTSSPGTAWTAERVSLARALLLAGSPQDALALANDTSLPLSSPTRLDAQFLSGWITLRYLHHAQDALPFFQPLTAQTSLVTRSRGFYWLGRAQDAAGNATAAQDAYRQAAAMPTTYYGQLALSALHGRQPDFGLEAPPIPGLTDALTKIPPVSRGALDRQDLTDAAELLVEQGDTDHAREFLMMLYSHTASVAGQAALADFSMRMGIKEPAVFAARATGRMGSALYPEGWPILSEAVETHDALPPAFLMAVARQESSFNPHAVSPARAIGLMQIQVGTARDVARRAGLSGLNTTAAGLKDPRTNMQLGRAYLAQLLDRFQNTVPAVLAAYNAGPHRTDQWLQANPLPSANDGSGMVDWIEALPFEETRSYIQRIEENVNLYRIHGDRHA